MRISVLLVTSWNILSICTGCKGHRKKSVVTDRNRNYVSLVSMSEKRQAEEGTIPAQKFTRIKLASPSPERSSGSDTESIYSCQGYKTEIVRDTSDTSSTPSTPLTPTSSTIFHMEYEIADPEEQKQNFYYSEGSDDNVDDANVELDGVCSLSTCDSLDKALLGDTSEENSTSPTSNSDVDPGLPRNDYLDFDTCLMCHTNKKDVSYPYCSACFSWKKNLFPSRPKKRTKSSVKIKRQIVEGLNQKTDVPPDSQGNMDKNLILEKPSLEDKESLKDSAVESLPPQLTEDTVDGCSQPSTSSFLSNSSNCGKSTLQMCRVCFLKPENGLFVHLNSAHVYGCYSCAKKVWYHTSVCPICRRKVCKVTKLYL